MAVPAEPVSSPSPCSLLWADGRWTQPAERRHITAGWVVKRQRTHSKILQDRTSQMYTRQRESTQKPDTNETSKKHSEL